MATSLARVVLVAAAAWATHWLCLQAATETQQMALLHILACKQRSLLRGTVNVCLHLFISVHACTNRYEHYIERLTPGTSWSMYSSSNTLGFRQPSSNTLQLRQS